MAHRYALNRKDCRVTTLSPTATTTTSPSPAACWRDAVARLRAAREVPFEVSAAETWRSAFVMDVEHAFAALDARVPGCDRVRAELLALAADVRGPGRIEIKDVVEACERAIALELSATQRCRGDAAPAHAERQAS